MRVEVINTGTELLLGEVVNTHLAYMGGRLFPHGLRIDRQVCVPDGEAIAVALREAFARGDVVFVTGGLGPTKDDMTRDIVVDVLGAELELDDGVLHHLEEFFRSRGRELDERSRREAYVPCTSRVLSNPWGTAPGFYIPADPDGKSGLRPHPHVFCLPGPPRELKPMFENEVEPILREIVPPGQGSESRYFKFIGQGESTVALRVDPEFEKIEGLEWGFTVDSGEVNVRLIGSSSAVERGAAVVQSAFPEDMATEGGVAIEEEVVRRLVERGASLALAESCTGGLLANRITNVPGASEVFRSGFVTYANEAKCEFLGVDPGLIEEHGAVSEPVAHAMALGCLEVSGADYALSVTGVAGPGGGTPDKPVGTVFMGLASRCGGAEVRHYFWPTDRAFFKRIVTGRALDLLRRRIG